MVQERFLAPVGDVHPPDRHSDNLCPGNFDGLHHLPKVGVFAGPDHQPGAEFPAGNYQFIATV
jgi:hypothetical protein